jgi:hypothetical protein
MDITFPKASDESIKLRLAKRTILHICSFGTLLRTQREEAIRCGNTTVPRPL